LNGLKVREEAAEPALRTTATDRAIFALVSIVLVNIVVSPGELSLEVGFGAGQLSLEVAFAG